MMDSWLINNAEKRDQVEAEDVKSDLSSDTDTQRSCIEERDYLQVFLRIRPFSSSESNSGESQDCVTIEPPDKVLLKPPRLSLAARLSADKSLPQTGQRFQFSQVYGPETTQKELFDGTVRDLVKDVLEGENSLLFTYGVTNAGKTFTFLGPDADAGILPRSLDVIFSSVDGRVFPGMSIKPQRCREFCRLSREQQAEEAAFKRNLLRQFKEGEKTNASLLNVTNKTLLEGTSVLGAAEAGEDRIPLKVETLNTKFSVWVSFCEIYNENIHDLLEVAHSGALRRTALRLSQDVKGNAFVKDLRWVQVNSAEEAYKVVKLGKKNQSFSSTRLNHLSSRSHSIFSVRVLRIEDDETQRVQAVSELCLCDLAGSERCAKTQNKGERLKEAGNINTSLLILGKCINALRLNQQAKLLQHVPFRESKLTHYLQTFFCGRGKACMVVNINQCASMYDETLNVLRFSAVAQKVVILSSRPLSCMPSTSSSEASFLHSAERKALQRSSPTGWESSLEDVQEDEDDEDEEDISLMEDATDQSDGKDQRLKQLQVQLKRERAENLLLEARVREEISQEFSELFSEMQRDYDERLARERDILEERAERRMEIFKNLIDKMSVTGASRDAVAMDKFLDSHGSDFAGIKSSIGGALVCPESGRAVPLADRKEAAEKPEQEQEQDLQRQEAQKHDAGVDEDEERGRLRLQLQEKSLEAAQLEKQLGELQKMVIGERRSHEREQLQEAVATLEKERREREDTLAALEYQTLGKEEALVSLQEERKAREEAVVGLQELRRHKEEMLASLEEERKDQIKATAALEEERRAKEDAVAALVQERSSKEEAQSALGLERKEVCRLREEREKMQQEGDSLQQRVQQLTDKLEAADRQVTSKMENAECTLIQLQAAGAQLEERSKESREKSSEINSLTQEVQRLKQELRSVAVSSEGVRDQQREEVSGLRKNLAEEEEKSDGKQRRILELERQLEQAKQQLAQKQLDSEQQLEVFTEKFSQSEAASKQQLEELRRKLQEEEKQTLEELRAQLECEKQEVEQLRVKLQQQREASEEQEEQLSERLREQDVLSKQKLEDLEQKLRESKETSSKVADDLKEKLRQQAAELQEAQLLSSSSEAEDLRRLNSELRGEVSSLKAKLSNMEATSAEVEEAKAKETQLREQLAELEKASAQKEAELQEKLQEVEAQRTSLQKSLEEAREQREEEECQAVQEARRKEAERRRELLAVAHEAIAQKDAELEKKAAEISSLKENAKQDSEKLKSLGLDLQRKEDDSSDLREKLADYKKQIQQVQKEISAMREEEKVLRQKVADVEKAKKQLQSEVASRDRSIQQLKAEQSSTRSDHTLQLYQKACKDLEDRQTVIEDMRLALTEQEETQEQMELVLEEKLALVQELSTEVEKLKGLLLQDRGNDTQRHADSQSDDLKLAKEQAARAEESLKVSTEKHQAERRKWMEEKLSLIGQAKEAEDKRNREMRKFAEDRERSTRLQSQLEAQLQENQQTMETWRKERDTLVAALEVQLQKLLSSQAEKDKLIQQLRQQNPQPPAEDVGDAGPCRAELQAALTEREAEILQLREQLQASAAVPQTESSARPAAPAGKPESDVVNAKLERRDTRTSVSSQSSAGFPSVLDASEISTENGRTSRFPRPELEISFSPLQPNHMALRRQGEESAVTVKITRSTRKRKSGEMEKSGLFRRSKRPTTRNSKEEVEAENRRNTRTKVTPKLTPHKEENSSPAGCHGSPSSIRSRKEGTLQKIGGFLQSSPTLLGSKAKKMMSLVSGRSDVDSASSSSFSLRAKKSKKKLYRPEISSPMDMPPHPIISRMPEEKESDHQIIKRRLRSRVAK